MSAKSDNPPYFPVGTVVSARYRGAYCSAVVKRVLRMIEVKVVFDRPDLGSRVVPEDYVKGGLVPGKSVDAKHPEDEALYKATIAQVMDKSLYTVVYDDGDSNSLRRSKLCAPGARHFPENESLDQFPLLSPEQFSSPVQVPDTSRGTETKRREAAAITAIPARNNRSDVISTAGARQDKRLDTVGAPCSIRVGLKASIGAPKITCKVIKKNNFKRKSKKKKKSRRITGASKKKGSAKSVLTGGTKQALEISKAVKTLEYRYFYVTPRESQVTAMEKKASCDQKRKAFIPKKVIRVLTPQMYVKSMSKMGKVPISNDSCQLNPDAAVKKNFADLSEDIIREPESQCCKADRSREHDNMKAEEGLATAPEEDVENELCIDYRHKKRRLTIDEELSSLNSTNDMAKNEMQECFLSPAEQNSKPVSVMYEELCHIVDEKKMPVPQSPPQGKNFNLVPNLENVTSSDEREILITESLKAVVNQYFLTKRKMDSLEKRKNK